MRHNDLERIDNEATSYLKYKIVYREKKLASYTCMLRAMYTFYKDRSIHREFSTWLLCLLVLFWVVTIQNYEHPVQSNKVVSLRIQQRLVDTHSDLNSEALNTYS